LLAKCSSRDNGRKSNEFWSHGKAATCTRFRRELHVGLCIAVNYTNNQRCQQRDNDVYDSTDAERV